MASVSSNQVSSSANNASQNALTNYNEQHNASRLSTSPSLSAHSGPSPIPANSTPPHSTEQPATLTPLKNMAQNQDSVEKVMLDMPHLDGSRSKFWSYTVEDGRFSARNYRRVMAYEIVPKIAILRRIAFF